MTQNRIYEEYIHINTRVFQWAKWQLAAYVTPCFLTSRLQWQMSLIATSAPSTSHFLGVLLLKIGQNQQAY